MLTIDIYIKEIIYTMFKISIVVILVLLQLTLSATNWTETDHAIQNAINEGIFSGCVLGIATDNATLLKKAYGSIGPKRGFYSPPVTTDMKFDLGHLTEPVAINAVLMDLFEKTIILPNNKISFLYSDFDNNGKRYITVQNLLEHNSGLSATFNGTLPATSTELMKAINTLKLEYTIENKTIFSQLGSIVLGKAIAKVTKQDLPEAMFQVLTIIGLRDTGFLPKTDKMKIVPGGYADQVAWGTPYNRLAHKLDNVAGNGGLFSTVTDIITYMQLLLHKGKMPMAFRVFQEATVDKFLTVTKYRYNNTRALGWQTVPVKDCPCGHKFSPSPDSFGMSDTPSGSYIWADKKRNVTIVLLTNGAFPGGKTNDPTPYQAAISDAIMGALGY